ncbi:MAG: phage portal protein [Muribaculaceae bacterium]|nr:phage portal protein [Muribaculaceae bacterium]
MIYQVMADNNEINTTNLQNWLSIFQGQILPQRLKLGAYYDGENCIVKQGAVKGRPNYSINVNMAKYIVDVATGYAFGVPVTYNTKDENTKTILEKLQYINKNNNVSEVDFQQGGDMATFGVSYQLIMAREGAEPLEDRVIYKRLDPLKTFYVTDNTVLENPLCAVYYHKYIEDKAEKEKIYVYSATDLYIFDGAMRNYTLLSQEPHNMGYIPIIQSLNNDDAFGDFQCVTDLLDSLSLAISNNTDNLQSIANAILAVSGGRLTEEQKQEINKSKIAQLPVGATMEWIIKNISPEAERMQIDNLLKFLFQISQVPDLTDDAFGGNQSGVAMRYKIWGLDQLWVTKTTKYKKSIFQRLKILLYLLQYRFKSNVELLDNIDVSFTRNLPQDNSEVYTMVNALKGVISDRTLLSNIPMVEDVDKELEELDTQAQKNADLYGFSNNDSLKQQEEDEDGSKQ